MNLLRLYFGINQLGVFLQYFWWQQIHLKFSTPRPRVLTLRVVSAGAQSRRSRTFLTPLQRFNSSAAGVQGAEHDHHQLLRPLAESGAGGRPGDGQTRGRVRLRLQQRPGSAHLQQHQLRLLPQPVPGAPQPDGRAGAEARSADHTQSTSVVGRIDRVCKDVDLWIRPTGRFSKQLWNNVVISREASCNKHRAVSQRRRSYLCCCFPKLIFPSALHRALRVIAHRHGSIRRGISKLLFGRKIWLCVWWCRLRRDLKKGRTQKRRRKKQAWWGQL